MVEIGLIADLIYQILGGTILVIVALGNFIVIIFFRFITKEKTVEKNFITGLAVTDGLACTQVFLLFGIPYAFFRKREFLHDIGCKYISFSVQSLAAASSWILVGLTFERYKGIVYHFKRNFKQKEVVIFCVVVWISCYLMNIPYFMLPLGLISNRCLPKQKMSGIFSYKYSYFLYRLISGIAVRGIIPLFFMLISYIKISRSLKRNSARLNDSNVRKRNKIVLKTLRLLIIVFAVAIFPTEMTDLILLNILPDFYSFFLPNDHWLWRVYDATASTYFLNNMVNLKGKYKKTLC